MTDRVEATRRFAARLDGVGGAAEVMRRVPEELAQATGLGRVIFSRITDGGLVPESAWAVGADPEEVLADLGEPIPLGYPLVEAEIVRRRRPTLVDLDGPGAAARAAHAATLGWSTFLVAPVQTDGRVAALVHADSGADGPPLTDADRDHLGLLADVVGLVVERSVLRQRLRDQQDAVRQLAAWADVRMSELSDEAIDLARAAAQPGNGSPPVPAEDGGLSGLLTRRELEVLELMSKGGTNGAIARTLVVAEGTVKFHVKNILRKMHASNRAEATSRYLQMTLSAHSRRG